MLINITILHQLNVKKLFRINIKLINKVIIGSKPSLHPIVNNEYYHRGIIVYEYYLTQCVLKELQTVTYD